jgi:hypothetical protein
VDALTERGRVILRFAGGVVLMLLIVGLSLKIASTLFVGTEDPDEVPELDPAQVGDVVEETVKVRALEPVRLKVEVDTEVAFSGTLCTGAPPGCATDTLRFGPAEEISVELADLKAARVTFQGRLVEPLGNVSQPRRLVFVDDAAP